MALENRATAAELLAAERFRACANRAYYAVYCALTSLLAGSVTFGYGNNNPTHNELPQFILNNLGGFPVYVRQKIVHEFRFLLNARAEADYLPAALVNRQTALSAVQRMENVFDWLEIQDD